MYNVPTLEYVCLLSPQASYFAADVEDMDVCEDAKRLISDYGYGGYNMVPAVVGVPVASRPARAPRAHQVRSGELACYNGFSDDDGDGDGTRVEEADSDDDSHDATAPPASSAPSRARPPIVPPSAKRQRTAPLNSRTPPPPAAAGSGTAPVPVPVAVPAVAAAVPELVPVTCETFPGELPAGYVSLAFDDNLLDIGMCITT